MKRLLPLAIVPFNELIEIYQLPIAHGFAESGSAGKRTGYREALAANVRNLAIG